MKYITRDGLCLSKYICNNKPTLKQILKMSGHRKKKTIKPQTKKQRQRILEPTVEKTKKLMH
jgi:hypothetical protein